MSNLHLGLPAPRLDWSKRGAPHNLDHDDGYFSDQDGSAEARTVFLAGCDLPNAWKDQHRFSIGELGFGTGLNFLEVWDLWRRTRTSGARLHFLSVEGAPFCHRDMERAHNAFPHLQHLAQKFRTKWPCAIKGVHRLFFDEDGITLTLYFMDVDEALPQMETRANGWFLDGFAPSRNEAMWSGTVFSHLARLSHHGARAATFSVAGAVRRGLQDVGFNVAKRPGHGRKRDRLEAVFDSLQHTPLRRHTRPHAPGNAGVKSVLILGGGIAGASVAQAFLRRNIDVTIISKAGLADEASGNPAALVSPRLDLEDAPSARFFRTAFHHAVKTYASLGSKTWNPCGLSRHPASTADAQKFTRLVEARALPADSLNLIKETGSLNVPGAGIVLPAKAICAMSDGAEQITASVFALRKVDGYWTAFGANEQPIAKAQIAVLALGSGSLEQTSWLGFRYLRGQVTMAKTSPPYQGPALMGDGYALGLKDGHLLTGATYDPIKSVQTNMHPSAENHARNLEALRKFAPALAKKIDKDTLSGRVAIRATTPDQMPYVGALVEPDDFLQRFHALQHGFLDPKVGHAVLQDGLFTLMGLGSRGFALAPILGEAVAAEVMGEPSPLERAAAEALHPARALERQIKRV